MQSINFLDSQHSLLSIARIGCYGAAAVFAGRKIALAANYKIGSYIAAFFDDNKLAKKLDSSSDHYLKLAKKNLTKDLAIASGLVATGFGLKIAEDPDSFFKIFENVMSPPVNNSEQLSIFGSLFGTPAKEEVKEDMKIVHCVDGTPVRPDELKQSDGELFIIQEKMVDGVVQKSPVKIYEGQLVGMTMHGKGKLVIPDGGITYEGEYHQGLRHGYGELTQSNGFVYKGQFNHGKEHGYGEYKSPCGNSYAGQFVNGKEDGEGKEISKNGEIFEGIFEQGNKKHGRITLPDGLIYVGSFENNLPSGYGKIIYPDGNVYEGPVGASYTNKNKQ